MTTLFHLRPYCRFIEIKNNFRRKKLQRTNQCSNSLRRSFIKSDNVAALIQFWRERDRQRQTQPLKTRFFIKSRPFYFHINSTVIRPVKLNKLIFCSIEITKPLTDGRSAMHSRGSIGPSLEPYWAPVLTGCSCKIFSTELLKVINFQETAK